jgi:uncharacterized protein (DUF934 family)
VALVFPKFRRPRFLRERYGFAGELTGQVLRDQFLFMLRAGFDSFEVIKGADAAAFARRSGAMTCSISRPATAAAPLSTRGWRA